MAAAARLNKAGYRTLLVEARDRVGGRASTVDQDGFRVNTGALIMETGGENGRLFDEIGVSMGTRKPAVPLVLRVGERNLPLLTGVVGIFVLPLVALFGIIARRFPMLRPTPGNTLAGMLARRGPYLRGLTRNITSAMFAAEPEDLDAAVVFDLI